MAEIKLHDESVRDLNPYSKSLSEDEKLRIIKEAMVNPDYFFRIVVKTKNEPNSDMPQVLNHVSHSLSIASLNRQAAKKDGNAVEYKFWNKIHGSLTKACSEMHEPQYERMKHGKNKGRK